jgi:hypothetical protein
MRIVNSDDKNYPYTILDGWGGKVHLQAYDLKDLKKQINQILKAEKTKENK